jgi:hypothetical protein
MRVSFFAFGFCLALAFNSFTDAELGKGFVQLLCALINIPGMIYGGNRQ